MSFGTHAIESALSVRRAPLENTLRSGMPAGAPLGALAYGRPADASSWMSSVNAPALLGEIPKSDLWLAGAHMQAGRTGTVQWRTDGRWAFGTIDLTEDEDHGLAALAHTAYRDLFRALQDTGCPHLLRIWNYLPRINEDGGGLERYRQFNMGRQQAFIEAGQAAYEGSPAACALGVQEGGLSIRFLAGQSAPLSIENPRQVSAYRYPVSYGPRPPTFSRAALADIGAGQLALLISGTASIVGHATVHLGDVAEQTREIVRNLDAVVEAANQRCTGGFEVADLHPVVYVRHADDAPRIRQVLTEAVGGDADLLQHAVFLQADICRQDLLVEIEAHAVSGGTLKA